MKIEKFENGKKLRRIIRMPNFLLRFKGKFDAKKSKEVIDAYVSKITHRASKLESREAIIVAKALSSSRERGAILINKISNARKTLAKHNDSANNNSNSPIDIRIARQNAALKSNTKNEYKANIEELIKIGEHLTYVHSIFQERDLSRKEHAQEKIQHYFAGVTSIIPNYNTNVSFNNSAFMLYLEVNKKTDEHIFNIIEGIRNESEV